MARRRKRPPEKKGGDAWIMTYADMMSLLLTFFVLIVSFSSIQETKFEQAALSLNDAFGVMQKPPSVIEMREDVVKPLTQSSQEDLLYEVQQMEQSLLEMGMDQEVDIQVTDQGIAFRIEAPFLFDSGRANLKPATQSVLNTLAEFINKVPYPLKIEGHTDSIPISNQQFPSNWELSATRSVAVARYFQNQGVRPQRMEAVGYGEYHPLDTNDTPEGRGKNRRVEIFMKLDPEQGLPQELPLQSEETSHGG
jgi:chemotaxis protein MotB